MQFKKIFHNFANTNTNNITYEKLLTLFVFALVTLTANAQEEIQLSCPNYHHPHLIDLGLPSGTKWACCNVDADKPEDYGGYYAFGEIKEKDWYDWTTYIHCDGRENTCHYIGYDIAGTQYDVAHVKWGGFWVMPSSDQIEELIDNCTYTWIIMNGVEGGLFTGPNGGTIFLPAAGFRWDDELNCAGECGYHWSSNPSLYFDVANILYFHSDNAEFDTSFRRTGLSVRPVSINKIIEGDMDGDGEININDVMWIVELILGAKDMTEQDLTHGDMDGDGELTVSDIMKLVDIILGNQ